MSCNFSVYFIFVCNFITRICTMQLWLLWIFVFKFKYVDKWLLNWSHSLSLIMYLFAFEKYGNENIKSSKIFSLFSDHDLDYLSWNILHSVINFWFFDRFTWRFNKFIWSGHQGKNCHVSFILREWLNLIEWVGNSNQGKIKLQQYHDESKTSASDLIRT